MDNPAIQKANTVFLSHSHEDQLIAYAFSEWLTVAWPELHVYLTHPGLSGREQLQEYSYLHATPHSSAMICLLTESSMTSNAVFDELEVALQAGVPVLHVMAPNPGKDDLRVYSYLKELWEPKYGKAHYTNTPGEERELLQVIAELTSREVPTSMPEGELSRLMAKDRTNPPTSRLRVPDVDLLEEGKGSRQDARDWLSNLEREHDNQMRIRGLPSVDPVESSNLPDGVRVARLIWTVPKQFWEQPIRQLQLLIDEPMIRWLHACTTDAPDPEVRDLAKHLIVAIRRTLRP